MSQKIRNINSQKSTKCFQVLIAGCLLAAGTYAKPTADGEEPAAVEEVQEAEDVAADAEGDETLIDLLGKLTLY